MSNEATIHWSRIIHDITSDENKDLHKLYSEKEGWLYLSDWQGKRYKIKDTDSFSFYQQTVDQVRRYNRNRIEG